MMIEPGAGNLLKVRVHENQRLLEQIFSDSDLVENAAAFLHLLSTALASGRTLYFFGNGGSAADSVHIAAEFVGRYLEERRPLPAQSLASNISNLTAIANDYGFEHVFSRQIEGLGQPGDVAVGLSTSGNSQNVVEALQSACDMGMQTVAMTGRNPGKMGDHAGLVLAIPSEVTPLIQQGHMLLAHIACEWVESRIISEER